MARLQGAQAVTTFSHVESPPRERGTTWSSVSLPPEVPQYAQRQPSRANNTRREMRRLTARGTRTYWRSRITSGRTNDRSAERRGSSDRSTTSAFPFHTRTCARRTEHTFSGS